MKFSLLFSIIFLGLGFSSYAQYEQYVPYQSTLHIGFGPSYAIGDFNDKNIYDDKAGLASKGGFLYVGYDQQISKYFGVTALVRGKILSVDRRGVLERVLPRNTIASLYLDAGSWKIGSALLGITQTLKASESGRLTLEFREMAGLQFTKSPRMDVNASLGSMPAYSGLYEAQSSNSLAFLVGTALNYNIYNNIGIKFFANYNTSQVKFLKSTNLNASSNNSVKKDISTIDGGIGLTIGL